MDLKLLVLMELSYFMLATFVVVESTGTSKTVLYMKPMVIGRTFDLSKSNIGNDIFDQSTIKLKTTDNYLSYSKLRIVKTKKQVRDVLDISGQLSLQIMAGQVNIKGEGKYLKESADSSNIVEVISKITFETITESIINVPTLRPGWNKDPIGQHYVRGITYGGYLIASLKFEARNAQHKQDIEAKVSASVKEGTLDIDVKGQFKKLSESVSDVSSLSLSYLATAPLKNVPTDIDSLVKAITDFPDLIKNSSSNGRGDPIQAHLIPLSQLDPKNDQLQFLVNSATLTNLNILNSQYLDLVTTMNAVTKFAQKYTLLTNVNYEKFGSFYDRVEVIFFAFNDVIAKLDLRLDKSQFQKAYTAYREGEHAIPGKFKREFDLLAAEKDNLGQYAKKPIAYRRNGTLFLRANNSYTPVAQKCKVKNELKDITMEIENAKAQLTAEGLSNEEKYLTVYIESQACNPTVRISTICSDNEVTSIQVNGKEESLKQRGHNIVVLNADTGEVTAKRVFGTHAQNAASVAMKNFLKSLPKRRLVLVGIQYSGEKLTNEAIESLKSIGGHGILNQARASYALIGWTGPGVLDATAQVQTRKLYGSGIIAKAVPLRSS